MDLKLNNITFKFPGASNYFFENLNATFISGQLNFIQGANGVGKSTLFNILLGDIAQGSIIEGSVDLDNKSYPVECLSNVGIVHQQPNLMVADLYTGHENLQLALLSAYPNLTELPSAIALPKQLMAMRLPLEKQVRYFSGGQRQLLAIMMALQKRPLVLLLDEPTAALDENNAHMIFSYLQELAHEINIVMIVICHDIDLVKTYGEKDLKRLVIEPKSKRRALETIALPLL